MGCCSCKDGGGEAELSAPLLRNEGDGKPLNPSLPKLALGETGIEGVQNLVVHALRWELEGCDMISVIDISGLGGCKTSTALNLPLLFSAIISTASLLAMPQRPSAHDSTALLSPAEGQSFT